MGELMLWCERCGLEVFDEEIITCRTCGDSICGNCRVGDTGDRCFTCIRRILHTSMRATLVAYHRDLLILLDDIIDYAVDDLGLNFVWRTLISDEGIINAYKDHHGHRFKYIPNDPENKDAIEGGVTWIMM